MNVLTGRRFITFFGLVMAHFVDFVVVNPQGKKSCSVVLNGVSILLLAPAGLEC